MTLSPQAKAFERRQKRLEAQKASRDPELAETSDSEPDAGMTDGEFRQLKRKTNVVVDPERVQERLARLRAGQRPVTQEEIATFWEIATGFLRRTELDSRDKTLIRDMMKIFSDVLRDPDGGVGDDDEDWERVMADVEAAWQVEQGGLSVDELRQLEKTSQEHVRRLLDREVKGMEAVDGLAASQAAEGAGAVVAGADSQAP